MKKLLLLVILLGTVAPSYSQFVAILTNLTPLTLHCDPACEPFSEGFATIYWDQNMNGPDYADNQPVVGNGFAQCNFNTIDMSSGIDLLGIPGTFATDPAFTISTTTPQPSRYYVVVERYEIRWQSSVFTINDGLNDIIVGGWTCTGYWVPPMPIDTVYVVPRPDVLQQFCLPVYYGDPIAICYRPVLPGFVPPISDVWSGCAEHGWWPGHWCSPCPGPDDFTFDPYGWQYDPATSSLCNWIIPVGFGCIQYVEDSHIPVQFGSFTADSRDHSILLTWTTHSERSIRNFSLLRDGVEIHLAEPANTATGATYTYLDDGLENGRTYTYAVNVVDVDGSVQSWPTTASASPSGDRAMVNEYALHQNYPNPFNPSTTITFDVVDANEVTLNIFNVNGQIVATPVSGAYISGRHAVNFDAANLTSGLYFYSVKIGSEFTATKKMLLVR